MALCLSWQIKPLTGKKSNTPEEHMKTKLSPIVETLERRRFPSDLPLFGSSLPSPLDGSQPPVLINPDTPPDPTLNPLPAVPILTSPGPIGDFPNGPKPILIV